MIVPFWAVRRNPRREGLNFAIDQRIFPSERAPSVFARPRARSFSSFFSLALFFVWFLRLLETSTSELGRWMGVYIDDVREVVAEGRTGR